MSESFILRRSDLFPSPLSKIPAGRTSSARPVATLPALARALSVSIESLIGKKAPPGKREPTPQIQQKIARLTRVAVGWLSALPHVDSGPWRISARDQAIPSIVTARGVIAARSPAAPCRDAFRGRPLQLVAPQCFRLNQSSRGTIASERFHPLRKSA